MGKLSFICSPLMVSKDGIPEFLGFHVEDGFSSPRSLGKVERGGWVGSTTGGARRRCKDEQSERGIISR
jgi:hypothetical protein